MSAPLRLFLLRGIVLGSFLVLWRGTSFAAPVTSAAAGAVVTGWLRADPHPLGKTISRKIKMTETVKGADGQPAYYVVHLDPTGYVIVPADDAVQPIVAFSATGRLDSASQDPVAILAKQDLPRRVAKARQGVNPGAATIAKGKWNILLGGAGATPRADSEQNGNIVAASQVWVAPFIQTLWNQSFDVSQQLACYNYYTPPGPAGNVNNYLSGCVSTALAQELYYFQYPNVGVGTGSFPITVNGGQTTGTLRGGDGDGGVYQWSNMPLNPDVPTQTQAEAIGDLTSDTGVSVNMDYEPGASSAFFASARTALIGTFKFEQADYMEDDVNGLSGSNLVTMLNPNIDARLPVVLGISGDDGGHCVLVDGYGYTGSALFHHLNAGWGGDDDVWYALPEIDTDNGDFNIVEACIYNTYPSGSGEIISGRVTDLTGAPVAGASVGAVRSGGGKYSATTDTNGIYALARIPSDSQYSLMVTAPGYATASGSYSNGMSQYNALPSGNLWGANFVLAAPLLAVPESGYAAIGPAGGPFSPASQNYLLTNTTAGPIVWTLANASSWLTVSASSGTLEAQGGTNLSVSLSAAANDFGPGVHEGTLWITNLNNNLAQSLSYSLIVEAADYPIALLGYNQDVVVENAAIGGNSLLYAQAFDPGDNIFGTPLCFYESGLNATNSYGGAAVEGLPVNGLLTSSEDNETTFQLGPYTSNNVLYLDAATNTATLALGCPAAYKTLSVLAASAGGGGSGTMVLQFADNSESSPISFVASNYFTTNNFSPKGYPGAALTNFGLLVPGEYNEFYSYDDSVYFPILFQTSINLESRGYDTKAITSATFTMPSGPVATGIFALSGTASPFPVITSQPQNATVGSGASVDVSVGATGAGTLTYRWLLNGAVLPGAQGGAVNIADVGATNAGNYQVIITNSSGAVTSAVATVTLTNVPVAFVTGGVGYSGGKLTLEVTHLTGQGPVVIAASTNLLQWQPIFTNPAGFGTFSFTDFNAETFPRRFYRATSP